MASREDTKKGTTRFLPKRERGIQVPAKLQEADSRGERDANMEEDYGGLRNILQRGRVTVDESSKPQKKGKNEERTLSRMPLRKERSNWD